MNRLRGRLVNLPHLTPKVWLTCELANTLESMIRHGDTGITLDRLKQNRISEPEANIKKLADGGALIEVVTKNSLNPYSATFEDTPHYVFKGWI